MSAKGTTPRGSRHTLRNRLGARPPARAEAPLPLARPRARRTERPSAPRPRPRHHPPPQARPRARPRPSLPFRRKKDMAGPGSGRRARGDWRGEGPAPLIQQPARTSGSAAAAALGRKKTRLPGVGPAVSWRRAGSSRRHVNNKPPARSSGPSPRGASREAARRPRAPPAAGRARAAHVTRARSLRSARDPVALAGWDCAGAARAEPTLPEVGPLPRPSVARALAAREAAPPRSQRADPGAGLEMRARSWDADSGHHLLCAPPRSPRPQPWRRKVGLLQDAIPANAQL